MSDATSISDSIGLDATHEGDGARAFAAKWWGRLDRWLEKAGDHLNPILVKETRQALKSRQFTITFVLLLIACWIVTIGGVAIVGPSIYYTAAGRDFLIAYFSILCFPLAVVVPYAAFRSLAAEQEENTRDLLIVSSLSPRQVINGKIGSAVLQMLVFLSAIFPCLAFTYLLRGVDVLTIAFLLTIAVLGSIGLSLLGLMFASLSKQRFSQVMLSVAFIAGLLWCCGGAISLASLFLYEPVNWEDPWFWSGVGGILTAYVTTCPLVYFCAAGLNTFTSANRSTPLRVAMVLQQAAFIGWITGLWVSSGYELEVVAVGAALAGAYWFVMGALLTSEAPSMSSRVRRALPQTTGGRAFLGLFNPGSGSGYLFAVSNLSLFLLLTLAAVSMSERRTVLSDTRVFMFAIIGFSYIVAYLGIGRLVVDGLRRFTDVTIVAGALIQGLVVALASGIPAVIHLTSVSMRSLDYSLMQLSNPAWTLAAILNGRLNVDQQTTIWIVVPGVALCVLLLSLRLAGAEALHTRLDAPRRVIEDDLALHPPESALPANPWEV